MNLYIQLHWRVVFIPLVSSKTAINWVQCQIFLFFEGTFSPFFFTSRLAKISSLCWDILFIVLGKTPNLRATDLNGTYKFSCYIQLLQQPMRSVKVKRKWQKIIQNVFLLTFSAGNSKITPLSPRVKCRKDFLSFLSFPILNQAA